MKATPILAVALLLSACGGVPTNVTTSSIAVKTDRFNGDTWITSPSYLSRQGITDTFPVQLTYRALYRAGRRQFVQLYLTSTAHNWGFFQSANGEDGQVLELAKIDSQVRATSIGVVADESFGLKLPIEYMQKMATKDWKIKVYGNRRGGVFVVPGRLTRAFLDKLNCHEAGTCKLSA